jgi:hypothetical protein
MEISYQMSRELDASDVTILSGPGKTAEPIANPVPARPAHAPLPNGWDKLPGCFAEWFSINEDFRTARLHCQLITDCRVSTFGTSSSVFGGNVGKVTSIRFAQGKPGDGVHHFSKIIDTSSPEAIQLETYIRQAEDEAEDWLKRLTETKGLAIQRAFLECGGHRIDKGIELQDIVFELASIGFKIFSIRVQALGLHESQVRRLFSNSSDAVRFTFENAYQGSMKFAGMAADGEMRVYVEEPVASTACHLLDQSAKVAQLTPLLIAGRKELARALKASLPAGLPS